MKLVDEENFLITMQPDSILFTSANPQVALLVIPSYFSSNLMEVLLVVQTVLLYLLRRWNAKRHACQSFKRIHGAGVA
jgi:hypothetical protein